MQSLLENPAFQAGIGPLVVALLIGLVLRRTAFAWLALPAAYATMFALSTGFAFVPLTAARKVVLLLLIAPIVGIGFAVRAGRAPSAAPSAAIAIAVPVGLAALAAVWVAWSVLVQRPAPVAALTGAGLAAFAAALVFLVLRLRQDAVALTASGLGLGLATGVAALLSASTGFLMSGIALAAGAGALLLLQFVGTAPITVGIGGALWIGLAAALFATATTMIAQLPWYALPLLLAIPLAAALPNRAAGQVPARRPGRGRIALCALSALAASLLPIAAAWLAARGSPG